MLEKKKRVLVVEDHPVVREGIKNILNRDENLKIVKETGDAEKALAYAKKHVPDLALVDITLAGRMGGIELTAALNQISPKIPTVILTVHTKVDFVGQAIDAGALAFVNKESTPEVLHEAIKSAFKGKHYLDNCLSPDIAKKLKSCAIADRKITDDSYGSLTPREQEVLSLLSESLTTKEVGKRLKISSRTAENYRSTIYKKLSIKNRIELVRYCVKVGISDPDKW